LIVFPFFRDASWLFLNSCPVFSLSGRRGACIQKAEGLLTAAAAAGPAPAFFVLCRAKPNGQNRPLYFRKGMEKLLRKMEKTTIIYKGNQTE